MRDCFTPTESNEANRKGHGCFSALIPTKKHQLTVYEALFLHVLTIISRGMGFIQFFNIYCQNDWKYTQKPRQHLSGCIFFKQTQNILLSIPHARLRGYNIWETLESFSRLRRFLNESPAAASPSNCNMCLHTVILMKGNDGVHFNDVEFKDCLLFQRKAIFFHGNMSLSFPFFLHSAISFWETDTEG